MKSAKFEIAFAILCIICAAVFFVSAAVSANISSLDGKERGAMPEVSQPAETQIPPMYTLMEHEGRVYVYSGGEPFMLTDIDADSLPVSDREKLRVGIGADNKEELLSLLEDFGS